MDKKKGSWEQATVGLMLFRCGYAGTKIIIIIIIIIISSSQRNLLQLKKILDPVIHSRYFYACKILVYIM